MKNLNFLFLLIPLIACGQPPQPRAERPAGAANGFKVSGDVAMSEGFEAVPSDQRLDLYVLGDSVSCGEMTYNTTAEMMQRTRNRHFKGWAMNLATPAGSELTGVFERLSVAYPVRMTNAAWAGAYVDKATKLNRSMANLLGGIQNFSAQMARLKKLNDKPNLILLAPFHNNLDFQYDLDNIVDLKTTKKEDYLASIPQSIQREYRIELESLIKGYAEKKTRVSIVLLGTMNIKTSLETRRLAEKRHVENPKNFPFFEMATERFPSILQTKEIVELAEKINVAIETLAKELSDEIKKAGRSDEIEVVYSKAINGALLDDLKLLHADDAFHPSALGQNKIAESIEKDLVDRIQFLGVKRR